LEGAFTYPDAARAAAPTVVRVIEEAKEVVVEKPTKGKKKKEVEVVVDEEEEEQPKNLCKCDECGFRFELIHKRQDGRPECPVCSLALADQRIEPELAKARVAEGKIEEVLRKCGAVVQHSRRLVGTIMNRRGFAVADRGAAIEEYAELVESSIRSWAQAYPSESTNAGTAPAAATLATQRPRARTARTRPAVQDADDAGSEDDGDQPGRENTIQGDRLSVLRTERNNFLSNIAHLETIRDGGTISTAQFSAMRADLMRRVTAHSDQIRSVEAEQPTPLPQQHAREMLGVIHPGDPAYVTPHGRLVTEEEQGYEHLGRVVSIDENGEVTVRVRQNHPALNFDVVRFSPDRLRIIARWNRNESGTEVDSGNATLSQPETVAGESEG